MPPARRICGGKNLDIPESLAYNIMEYPGVAKFGIALGSGPRGRGFESRHSDQKEHLHFMQVLFLRSRAAFRTHGLLQAA